MEFIKIAAYDPRADDLEVRDRVAGMLEEIERDGKTQSAAMPVILTDGLVISF